MNKHKQTAAASQDLRSYFPYWGKTKDLIDQLIDLVVKYRQSGHPGGSRSKVHLFLTTLLSGAMRWDIRNPTERFSDRFILGAGHTIPLVYCTLAVLNEALRILLLQTGNPRFEIRNACERALHWEHLLGFRRKGVFSGHAEMQGRTLFLKFSTGPSGHGSPAAAGIALALKRASLGRVKVFILEGEGGLTPGSTHETLNSAWGLALENLYFLVDWNDFGIDEHPVSAAVYGGPADWFGSHGWRVSGAEAGEDWQEVARVLLNLVHGENPDYLPGAVWVKSRKGRGYLKYDHASHGSPHAINSALFWETKRVFAEKYGAHFMNFGGPPPQDDQELQREYRANIEAAIKVLEADQSLVEYLAERLIEIGDGVPAAVDSFRLAASSPLADEHLYDFHRYPNELFASPG